MRIKSPNLAERIYGACLWLAILILGMAVLTGCGGDRWLTAEQDAELRAQCEETGCKVIQTPLWQQIEQLLHMLAPQPRPGVTG